MAQSNLDRQLNEVIEGFIIFIGKLLKAVYYGIKKLKKINTIIPFLICLVLMVIVRMQHDRVISIMRVTGMPAWVQNILYTLILLSPILYLAALGSAIIKKQIEYFRYFEKVGFREKTGKYPLFLSESRDKEGHTLSTFRSNISVGEWKKKIPQLETALDCTILTIENKSSKRIVEMLTVSSEFKIPDKLLWNNDYILDVKGHVVVGEGMLSQVTLDFNRNAHMIAAGETGSGKSVIIRCCLWQLINQGARAYMIDFKGGVEFGIDYERYGEVIMDRERAAEVLEMLVQENNARLALFRPLKVKNLPEYNKKTGKNLCMVAVVIDEIAELLDKKGVPNKERQIYERMEGSLSTLARQARATGIILLLGVQRPDSNVLTGQIKNNITIRICGRFADKSASEIVLNTTAAVNLPNIRGRFLYLQANELIEFQAYYFDDETMLDKSTKTSQGEMLIENRAGGRSEAVPSSLKSKEAPKAEVKEVNYEDFDFNYEDEETIEWSVDK